MRIGKQLDVYYGDRHVGTLALTKNYKVAFEYNKEWLRDGFAISPFSLPLEDRVFLPGKTYFDGLFGVFGDSLPDAWGNLLMDRMLKKKGISKDQVTVLDRLAMVGENGMGALTYRPSIEFKSEIKTTDFDVLAEECNRILNAEDVEHLDELYQLGGSSGGTRPKIHTKIEGQDWIIKFPSRYDPEDIGQMEYDYSLCAKACGIQMFETRLFDSKRCDGYFGTKRFDRKEAKRIHTITSAALLEIDYNQPALDYHSLMKMTNILTRGSKPAMEQMYLRTCFNVFAHNRDDHAKNFSFFYDENAEEWKLAPAYDLTYSTTYYGEHTTSVDGNGANPGEKELLAVGKKAGLSRPKCKNMMELVRDRVNSDLKEYVLQ